MPEFLRHKPFVLLAAAGSAALLLAAWFFEFVVGLAPCAMCYWQRWPHMAAVAIGVLAAAPLPVPAAIAAALAGAAAAATTAGIGAYHTGVERGWWPGPASCTSTGQDLGGLSGDALLDTSTAAPVVLCDEIAWTFLGLSMANWNMLASAALACLWLAAAWRSRMA
ncbi:MAG: disulfide bond formation protein B [Paracoccaceae bacterium]|jgi:disulfide bond formation protein DsbB|nr:disulfide bond formation protein B [Paracoccaceae bacterium]